MSESSLDEKPKDAKSPLKGANGIEIATGAKRFSVVELLNEETKRYLSLMYRLMYELPVPDSGPY